MDKHQADLERVRKRAAGEAETQRRYRTVRMYIFFFRPNMFLSSAPLDPILHFDAI